MRALVFTVAILTAFIGYSQNSSSFFEAIKSYEESLGVTFSFDAELLKLADTKATFSTNDLEQFKSEVEQAFPLEIVKIDEEYYTISPVLRMYKLSAMDSLDGVPITESFGLQIIVNDAPVPTKFEDRVWQFSYKVHPADQMSVFSQGYKTVSISVKDLFNQTSIEISLGLPTKRLNTVVVEDYLTKGINLMPSRQQIQIDVNDLPLLPGETDGDIFASVAALPGISNPDGRAGNLLIRGSETDQTLILFDNIPIYHRGHYYGTISPYNPKIIDDVEVYRSGFHPRLGDRVGGAIVINSDAAQDASKFGVGANTLFGMGYGKFKLSDKWSGTLSIRNSYPREYKSPKLEEISESVFAATSLIGPNGILTKRVQVGFSDYNVKLKYHLDEQNSFELSGIYTFSDINFMPIAPPDLPQRANQNRYENLGANLSWKSILTNGWTSVLNTTYSKYDFEFTIKTLAPGVLPYESDNGIKDFNIVQEFTKKNKYSNLEFGLDYKWQEVSTNYLNELPDSTVYALNESTSSTTIAPYANFEYYGLKRWYVQFGFRSNYYSALKDFSVLPRILVNYDLSDKSTLKSSFGRYNQYLSQVKNLEYSAGGFDNELWTLADNESGFIITGSQAMLGAVTNVNNWIFDIEGFYKTANDITIYENRRLHPDNDFYTMDQETYGLDVLLKKQLSEFTSIWTGYSYHDSKITIDTTDQVSYKSKYVQPHVWYVGGAYKKNRWKVSAGWRYASGLNAQSLDIAYAESIFLAGPSGPPPPGPPPPNPFADLPERYPSVHSLDVSASYKIPQSENRKWSASFGLSIINALNQENLTDRVFRSRQGFVDRNAIGFAPNLMVILEW